MFSFIFILFCSLASKEIQTIKDIDDTIASLKMIPGVQLVKVNSTLGRHLTNSASPVQKPQTCRPGSARKLALIICNKIHRENWEFQFNDVFHVLEQQLGFQVWGR